MVRSGVTIPPGGGACSGCSAACQEPKSVPTALRAFYHEPMIRQSVFFVGVRRMCSR